MLVRQVALNDASIKGEVMKREYDFSAGVRGKYLKWYQAGSNIIVLDPEIAEYFSDSASVNEALRALIRAAGHNKPPLRTRKSRRRA